MVYMPPCKTMWLGHIDQRQSALAFFVSIAIASSKEERDELHVHCFRVAVLKSP